MKKDCKPPAKPKPYKTGGPVKRPVQGGGNGNGPPEPTSTRKMTRW